ncbi:MAG: hypothetical protein AAGK93_02500, partial [Pseudomonadota bacterium]
YVAHFIIAHGGNVRLIEQAQPLICGFQQGYYRTMKHPVEFSATPADIALDPPTLGADTETVLASLGL